MGLDSGRRLPDWSEEGTDSSLRDSEDDHISLAPAIAARAIGSMVSSNLVSPTVLTPIGGPSPVGSMTQGGLGGKGGWTNLDKFYEGEDDSDEEESEEGSEEESEKDYEGPPASRVHVAELQHEESVEEYGDGDDESNEGSFSSHQEDPRDP